MQTRSVLAIAKFGKRVHIEGFVRGQLFMNPLSYFAELEGDALRSDAREANAYWLQSRNVVAKIKIGRMFVPIEGLSGPIGWSSKEEQQANVFCMYAFRDSQAGIQVDHRNLQFGDTFAILKDGTEFFRRVRVAAEKEGHVFRYGLVEYLNEESYEGKVGLFRKSSKFSYQSECRIALLPGSGMRYILDVGDLSDITAVGPLQELNDRVRLSEPSAENGSE